MKRHFTASAYVVKDRKILLHHHEKVGLVLPPGGHIEPNETPSESAIREVEEETGFKVKIIKSGSDSDYIAPRTTPNPRLIQIEDIDDPIEGPHQHIDFIFYCSPTAPNPQPDGWYWFSIKDLKAGIVDNRGNLLLPPEDVVELGTEAIRTVC